MADDEIDPKIDERWCFTEDYPNLGISKMDKLFSYDQKQTYKQTKEEFDKHVAAKKKSNPGKAVLTLLYVKKVDLKNPIIRDGTKVC